MQLPPAALALDGSWHLHDSGLFHQSQVCPYIAQVQRQYSRDVNFVALNIENSRWAPEVSEYRVRGIPYYAFLDGSGRQQAAAVGRLPREVCT